MNGPTVYTVVWLILELSVAAIEAVIARRLCDEAIRTANNTNCADCVVVVQPPPRNDWKCYLG